MKGGSPDALEETGFGPPGKDGKHRKHLVTTSKAPVTSSVALVTTSVALVSNSLKETMCINQRRYLGCPPGQPVVFAVSFVRVEAPS